MDFFTEWSIETMDGINTILHKFVYCILNESNLFRLKSKVQSFINSRLIEVHFPPEIIVIRTILSSKSSIDVLFYDLNGNQIIYLDMFMKNYFRHIYENTAEETVEHILDKMKQNNPDPKLRGW